jgi:hypothetical protein
MAMVMRERILAFHPETLRLALVNDRFGALIAAKGPDRHQVDLRN